MVGLGESCIADPSKCLQTKLLAKCIHAHSCDRMFYNFSPYATEKWSVCLQTSTGHFYAQFYSLDMCTLHISSIPLNLQAA